MGKEQYAPPVAASQSEHRSPNHHQDKRSSAKETGLFHSLPLSIFLVSTVKTLIALPPITSRFSTLARGISMALSAPMIKCSISVIGIRDFVNCPGQQSAEYKAKRVAHAMNLCHQRQGDDEISG